MNVCSLCGSTGAGLIFGCLVCGGKFCSLHRPRASHSCPVRPVSLPKPETQAGPEVSVTSMAPEERYAHARAEARTRIEAAGDQIRRARTAGLDVTSYEIALRDARTALDMADPDHAIRLLRAIGERLQGFGGSADLG